MKKGPFLSEPYNYQGKQEERKKLNLFSSRSCLNNNMMSQKGPRLMFFVNHTQQLRSDVKIIEIQGTVTELYKVPPVLCKVYVTHYVICM